MSVEIPALLIIAMMMVESSADRHAVGDSGQSVGILQISPAVVEDVNRICADHGRPFVPFTLDDRLSLPRSIQILEIYLGHYASPERLGRAPAAVDLVRIWNGGPDGHLKRAQTEPYVRKVSIIYGRLIAQAVQAPRVDVPGEIPAVQFRSHFER